MDSARTYEKYLNAKSRVERIIMLISKLRHFPLRRISKSLLPAGRRLCNTCACLALPNSTCFKQRFRREPNCQDTPSSPRLECNIYELSGTNALTSESSSKHIIEPINSPTMEPEYCLSICGIDISFSKASLESIKHLSFQENLESVTSQVELHPEDCNQIPQISTQLTSLIKKLENQVACEIKKKEKLNAINYQLKQLSATVTSLVNLKVDRECSNFIKSSTSHASDFKHQQQPHFTGSGDRVSSVQR